MADRRKSSKRRCTCGWRGSGGPGHAPQLRHRVGACDVESRYRSCAGRRLGARGRRGCRAGDPAVLTRPRDHPPQSNQRPGRTRACPPRPSGHLLRLRARIFLFSITCRSPGQKLAGTPRALASCHGIPTAHHGARFQVGWAAEAAARRGSCARVVARPRSSHCRS